MAPQAIEIPQNGLANGAPPFRGCWEGESIRRFHMKGSAMSWPTDITAMDKGRVLEVSFDDGQVIRLTAERLRVESPSAEVQGHSPSQKRTVTGKENVAIVAIEPIGNYAIKIVFDDGHDTGLYSWDYLRKLAS
jgi:DUF971 family protein